MCMILFSFVIGLYTTKNNLSFLILDFLTNNNEHLGKRWNNLKDCTINKGVHLSRLCKLSGEDSWKIGIVVWLQSCERLIFY
jgi:hypothetical protein